MSQFLMIENPGVAPTEGYILFGATTKRDSFDKRIIGTFGSGNKHAVSVSLRQSVPPVIYCGNQKMSFYTKPVTIKGVGGETTCQRICVKFGGKDADGKATTADKELDQTLEYGAKDWKETALALREFVSNAIDACYEQNLDHSKVVIELVDESKVRAKADHTRVFVPATMEVMQFYKDLGKWFLHFSEPESLEKMILQKKNRNRGDWKNAVIYRRGVLIREFGHEENPSLFDYNLPDLHLNESRESSDWDCRWYAGKALRDADTSLITIFFRDVMSGQLKWEHNFDSHSFVSSYDSKEYLQERGSRWQSALEAVAGPKGCLTSNSMMRVVSEKGYIPLILSDSLLSAMNQMGVKTDQKVLSENERAQRAILPATNAVICCLDELWQKIDLVGLAHGRSKPVVACFRQQTQAGSTTLGYWSVQNDGIYINADISEAVTDQLRDTIIEECCHYVTKATDGSRDFANWLIRFAVEMSKAI